MIPDFFLLFGKEVVIAPLALYGYIFHDKNKWGRVIYITLFSMIVCAYLKGVWQVPLAPWLKSDGWAFPSGHMFSACAFYLWISYEMKKRWISILSVVILCGLGFSLVYKGFHDVYDVLGAVVFVLPFLFLYVLCVKIDFFAKSPHLLILPIFPVAIMLLLFMSVVKPHVIGALLLLCVFAAVWCIIIKRS